MVIDVREPQEYALAHLEGSLLMPMQSVPAELQKLEGLADESDLLFFATMESEACKLPHGFRPGHRECREHGGRD